MAPSMPSDLSLSGAKAKMLLAGYAMAHMFVAAMATALMAWFPQSGSIEFFKA